MSTIREGDHAPDATLTLQTGDKVALGNLWRESPVVLFFYPRDGSFVCTKEACAFRDAYEGFVATGATVIGIRADSAESHRGFAEMHRLPFLLATDTDGSLRKEPTPPHFEVFRINSHEPNHRKYLARAPGGTPFA